MTVVFDRDVPIPPLGDKYGLSAMEVGDSRFIAGGYLIQQATRVAVHRATQKLGYTFTTRKVTEKDANGNLIDGTRYWRLS